MAKKSYQAPLPWEDRWNQPDLETLLKPIRDPQIKPFRELMQRLADTEGVAMQLQWQGISWKWSFVYRSEEGAAKHPGLEQFAYLVPRPAGVIVCIPLTTEFIQALPFRRLNRYIRDGVRVAKCAVDIHWAQWTPMAMTEVEHLHDLIKRKSRFIRGEDRRKNKPAKDAAPAKAEEPATSVEEKPPAKPKSTEKPSKKKPAKAAEKKPAPKKTVKKKPASKSLPRSKKKK